MPQAAPKIHPSPRWQGEKDGEKESTTARKAQEDCAFALEISHSSRGA
jgi:hypothetical protein